MVFLLGKPAIAKVTEQDIQNIFSSGRSLGAAYYNLLYLTDRSIKLPYSSLKKQYEDAFQYLSISDVINNDILCDTELSKQLFIVRQDLYYALKNQELNSDTVRKATIDFNNYYSNLSNEITKKYNLEGQWLLNLGFYSSFQQKSLSSKDRSKLLLTNADILTTNIPVNLNSETLTAVKKLDYNGRRNLTAYEAASLKQNINDVIVLMTNYPNPRPIFREKTDLIGSWQGIMLNSNRDRINIKLSINKDLTGNLSIGSIAKNIKVYDIELVNNYFTFTYNPLGTEKLFIRFNARLTDSVFSGEIIDAIGEKSYWVLAKEDENCKNITSDKMLHYANYIENNIIEQQHDTSKPEIKDKID